MANAINVIYPYKDEGMWVFDDEKVELDKEPFVAGADVMIDQVLSMKGIANPEIGFRLIFSAGEFPQYDIKLDWVREGDGGNWYNADNLQMEGWLCPALLLYFDAAPKHIYVKVEEKTT